MKVLTYIKKLLNYSVFDELIEAGAERLTDFPEQILWMDRPQFTHIDNFRMECGVKGGALVAGIEDSIILARWNRKEATKIPIRMLKINPDILNHRKKLHRWWNENERPFILNGLKIGIGTVAHDYIENHKDFISSIEKTER